MTFLLNKKIIVSSIFFGFLAFLVFIPLETANAWVFDLGMKQLDALDFVDTHVLPLLYRLLKYLVLSQAFLIISAGLLEWTINLPIILQGNPLVTGGWSFILGLTNLFFLLFFIYIALCHILKIEIGKAFSTTKALTRLIIIALLVNFSLVFIGMFIDVAEVALAAIRYTLVGDGSLIRDAIQPLGDNILILARGFTGTLTTYLAAALFPYASVASTVFLFGLAITEAFTGGFTMAILLTAFGAMMGAIFLIYAIFFLVRVVIIWLLAITAPLALASWIFPKTEKHFQTWFKTLIEWLFLGIAGMFFMGLGLNFFANLPAVLEMGDPIKFGRVDIFPAFGFNYLFLILYLAVSLYFVKKYLVPKAMVQAIEQAEGMVKRAGGYGALADRTWSKTAGKVWTKMGGPEKISRIGERLQTRGIDDMKKLPEDMGKLEGVIKGAIPRLRFRTGATLRRADKERPKSFAEAEERIDAAQETIKGDLKKKEIFDKITGKKRKETSEEVAKRVAIENFSGYNQAQRVASMRHFGKGEQRTTFFKNVPEIHKKATMAQARGTYDAKILNQVAPEKFIKGLSTLHGGRIEKAIQYIESSKAHNIGIESLKKLKVALNLSLDQMHNIATKGNSKQAEAIKKAINQITKGKLRNIAINQLPGRYKGNKEKIDKAIRKLSKKQDKIEKYMDNSAFWKNI